MAEQGSKSAKAEDLLGLLRATLGSDKVTSTLYCWPKQVAGSAYNQ